MATMALPLTSKQIAPEDVHRLRYVIAFAVTLASVLELVDTSIVNVAIPHMMGNLGATLEEIAWVSTGYIVANVIVLPLTSWFADRFGRRNYYTGSILLFTTASFFCGNASSLEGLVAWRIIQGIGGGALISTAQTILFDIFPGKERAKGTAIFGVGVMVGPALGPTLGGWITENYSWPWIFYINIPLGIIAAILCARYVPEPVHKKERSETIDWWGVFFLILGIGALQILLERGQAKGWFESREIVIETVLAATGIVSFIIHELRTEHPIVDLRVFKNRQLAAGVLFGPILGFALYSSIFALPVFLQTLVGYTAWDTGKILFPRAIATALTMVIGSRIVNKIDARYMIATGVFIFFSAMVMSSHFTTELGRSDIFWPMILTGVGLGFVFPPLTALAVADLHPSQIGQGTGLFNLARQLGGSFGIAVTATLLTHFTEEGREALRAHATLYDPATRSWLAAVTQRMQQFGGTVEEARIKASALLDLIVKQQASVIAFEKVFLLMGTVFVVSLPMLLLFRTGKVRGNVRGSH